LNPHPHFGGIIGRYANRIAGGKFELYNQTYQLAQNNGPNNLHGGANGFDKKIWNVKSSNSNSITLSMLSPDGDEGFPGTIDVEVTYTLNDANQLMIDYKAKPIDKATIINLTNHSYFNLDGSGNGDVLNHILQIDADFYHAVDENLIPLKEDASVSETPFDFRTPTTIGARINEDHPQLELGSGYDQNYIVNGYSGKLNSMATVQSSDNQITMVVMSTEPGVQLYTANHLNIKGKNGAHYKSRSGFCLETQHFPNSPNRDDFPSTVVEQGEEYRSSTVYGFS